MATADLFPGFASHWIDTEAGKIFARSGGKGPPLLVLHGFPQTHVQWHKVAERTGAAFHPDPARPAGLWLVCRPSRRRAPDHSSPTAKRDMAGLMIEVMEQLGHIRFAILSHDRGSRVELSHGPRPSRPCRAALRR